MKVICFHNVLLIVLCLTCQLVFAQVDTLYIDEGFKQANLIEVSNRFSSSSFISIDEAYKKSLEFKNENIDFAFFDVDEDFGFLSFSITNTSSFERKLVLEVYNSLLNDVSFFEKNKDSFGLINNAGTDFPFSARLKNDRNFLYPLKLQQGETKTYIFQFKKNKISIVVPAKIWTDDAFQKRNKYQYLLIGLYYGLCFISIIISLYIFYVLRKYLYVLYALYIVFLGLYLFSYLGLYFQYFSFNDEFYNKYIHVFFASSSLILFAFFAIKVLKTKAHSPRLTNFIVGFLSITIIIRFSEFFLPSAIFLEIKPMVIRYWYLAFIIANAILVVLTFKSFKTQKKITTFFAISYSFMGIGTIITVINLSTGKINAFIQGLPILFYTSFLEIIFLTFTIIIMIKEIYDERNLLSHKIVTQQKGFLAAFMEGEERERSRISKELHDNIGSRLSYLKLFVSTRFKSKEVNDTIDSLCNDVRSLSHEIAPSDLKLIGFEKAVSELSKTISSQTTISVNFNSYSFPKSLNENISTQLYRIVQEAFNNIIKHANAKNIHVQLVGHVETVTLTIEDDGNGFDIISVKNGIGLKNIESRVQQLHGEFSIDSELKIGTSILVTIPI